MIEVRDISRMYPMGAQGVQALRGVSLRIDPGDFVAIMGPSGSGKSTLLHVLGFLDKPDTGEYLLGGRDISKLTEDELSILRNHVAGFVFQQFHLLKRSTALENVELPLVYAGKRDVKSRALDRIRDVGLESRASHAPNELSGGEQQRVAIARALVNDPPLLFADEPTGNLDTKSEEEILRILEELNRAGKTILLVTHEKEVADRAKRIIWMRDGWIVSDERIKPLGQTPPSFGPERVAGALDRTGYGKGGAEWVDHLREAVRAIVSNRLRSALSVLGVMIGVGAVIAMLALGEGAKASIAQRLASLGSNLLLVRPGSPNLRGVAMEAGSVTRLTRLDVEAIAKLPQVARASGAVRGRAQLVRDSRNWNTQAHGVDVEYESMRSAKPTVGRFFTEEEMRTRQRVVLLGTTVARQLYGVENPVGSVLKINRVNFQVIGVLPSKGSSGWSDDDDIVVVPLTTAMYRLLGKQYVDSIDVEARDAASIQEAERQIRRLIIKRKRLTKQAEDSFQVRNMAQMQEALQSTTRTMTMLLGSIAAISLLVGGIGIMNIMLVSVTERTREIGLRKALGARRSDIIKQFLIESVTLSVSGGALGIALGVGAAAGLSRFAGWATQLSAVAVVMATSFSVLVGLTFGSWPARQASRLDPVEALRYE